MTEGLGFEGIYEAILTIVQDVLTKSKLRLSEPAQQFVIGLAQQMSSSALRGETPRGAIESALDTLRSRAIRHAADLRSQGKDQLEPDDLIIAAQAMCSIPPLCYGK